MTLLDYHEGFHGQEGLWDMFGSIRLWLINTFPRQDPAAAKNVFFGNLVSQDLRYCFCY